MPRITSNVKGVLDNGFIEVVVQGKGTCSEAVTRFRKINNDYNRLYESYIILTNINIQ